MKKKEKRKGITGLILCIVFLFVAFFLYLGQQNLEDEVFKKEITLFTWVDRTTIEDEEGNKYYIYIGLLNDKESLIGQVAEITFDKYGKVYELSIEDTIYFSKEDVKGKMNLPYSICSITAISSSLILGMYGSFFLLKSKNDKEVKERTEFPIIHLDDWKDEKSGLINFLSLQEEHFYNMSVNELKIYRLSSKIPDKMLVFFKSETGLSQTFCERIQKNEWIVPIEKNGTYCYPFDQKEVHFDENYIGNYKKSWEKYQKEGYIVHFQNL